MRRLLSPEGPLCHWLSLIVAIALLCSLGYALFTRDVRPLVAAVAVTALCCAVFGVAESPPQPQADDADAQGGA